MRPTALGVKAASFFVLLIAAFFATPYSNLFFLILAFLGVLGLANVWWTRGNLEGMTGEVAAIAPAPAGAPVPIGATVDAGGRARFGLTLALELEGGDTVRVPAGLVQGETHLAGRVAAMPRGVYPIRAARLESVYPLGLLRARRPLPAPAALVVYPAPAELPEKRDGADALGEMLGHYGADGLLQPSGLREYQPGEDLRRVHWKASARRETPVIQEWEGGLGEGTELVLDRRTDPARLEEALSLVAALALAARDEKEALTLHTQGLSATFGSGHGTWDELLTFLAGADRLEAGAPPPPPAPPAVPRLGGAA